MTRFTSGELSVMYILWEQGEFMPREVQERFPEPIRNPALCSYLNILMERDNWP